MCIWGNKICTIRRYNKVDLNEPHRQYNFDINQWQFDETHQYDHQIRTSQCMANSMTTSIVTTTTATAATIKRPTKSYQNSIGYIFRWHLVWHSIFLLWSLNLITVAIANDNIGILNVASLPTSQQQQQQPQQPCNRSRRVFTDAQGEISDGPTGSNYTQVSCNLVFFPPLDLIFSIYRNYSGELLFTS